MAPVAPSASATLRAQARSGGARPLGAAVDGWTAGLLAWAGGAAAGLQILWGRALRPALAPMPLSRAAAVAAVAVGLALGAALGARGARRTRQPALAEAMALWAAAAAVATGTAQIDRVGGAMARLAAEAGPGGPALWAAQALIVAAVALPAALALAALVAQRVVRLAAGGPAGRAGRRAVTGAWALAGSLAGHLLVRAVLVPTVGVEVALRLLAGGCLVAGAARLLAPGAQCPAAPRVTVLLSMVGLGAGLATWPRWDVAVWAGGGSAAEASRRAPPRLHLDGALATVVAMPGPDGGRLYVDGQLAAAAAAVGPEALAGALPDLLGAGHGDRLVLGLGTGAALAPLLATGAAVTAWEPEPAVGRGLRALDLAAGTPWTAPNLAVGTPPPARLWAAAVAVAETSSACPDPGGCAPVALDRVLPHLAPSATLVVRLPAAAAGSRLLRQLPRRFDAVLLVDAGTPAAPSALAVGRDGPLRLATGRLTAAAAAALGRAGIEGPAALAARALADAPALAELAALSVPAPTGGDGLARALAAAMDGRRLAVAQRLGWEDGPALAALGDAYLARGLWADAAAAAAAAQGGRGHDADSDAVAAETLALAQLLAADQDAEGLLAATAAAGTLPALAQALARAAEGHDDAALAALEADRAHVAGSAAALMVYGALLERAGQPQSGRRALAAAAAGDPVAAVTAMRRYRGAVAGAPAQDPEG